MKRCLICGVNCAGCRGGLCRCGMTGKQVQQCNEIIIEYQLTMDDYRVRRAADMFSHGKTKEDVELAFGEGLSEEEQKSYEARNLKKPKKDGTELLCKYDGMGVWSKCTKCGTTRWEKQKDLSKICKGSDSIQN